MSDEQMTLYPCAGCGRRWFETSGHLCQDCAFKKGQSNPTDDLDYEFAEMAVSQDDFWTPCPEGNERCAVDGIECECEKIQRERQAQLDYWEANDEHKEWTNYP